MAIILKKYPKTKKEILEAIFKIAIDKNTRAVKDDYIEWLETKLHEIAILSKRLITYNKLKGKKE